MTHNVTCPGCDLDYDRLELALCPRDGTDLWALPDDPPEPDSRMPGKAISVTIAGAAFRLDVGDAPLLLGRDEGSQTGDALAEFSNVSRSHAIVENSGEGVRITDLGSTNGTYIDGDELADGVPLPIMPGQELRLASDVIITIAWDA